MVPMRRSRRERLPIGWRHVDPPQRPVLFINTRSGGGIAARAGVGEHARERGVDVVTLTAEQSLAELVRNAVARGADALGMAGGDGSLATVAAAACEHGLPFTCIPAGTRNHFALDLGVDRSDLLGALDAFTDGIEGTIDVAEVNGRIFLNNVSLGIYGDAVRRVGRTPGRKAARGSLKSVNRCSARARSTGTDWSTTWDARTPIRRSCSCRTTLTPLIARRVGGTRPTLVGGRTGSPSTRSTWREPAWPGPSLERLCSRGERRGDATRRDRWGGHRSGAAPPFPPRDPQPLRGANLLDRHPGGSAIRPSRGARRETDDSCQSKLQPLQCRSRQRAS